MGIFLFSLLPLLPIVVGREKIINTVCTFSATWWSWIWFDQFLIAALKFDNLFLPMKFSHFSIYIEKSVCQTTTTRPRTAFGQAFYKAGKILALSPTRSFFAPKGSADSEKRTLSKRKSDLSAVEASNSNPASVISSVKTKDLSKLTEIDEFVFLFNVYCILILIFTTSFLVSRKKRKVQKVDSDDDSEQEDVVEPQNYKPDATTYDPECNACWRAGE
ncbi:hypothetical Membrane Spanning Protein, partial [Trichinella spiralis]|uniref:hypothetical Membrane Spanning Protein n=1 Tax=Trichinella spiralis TaxID=6334 RepID=UPI0001EFDC82